MQLLAKQDKEAEHSATMPFKDPSSSSSFSTQADPEYHRVKGAYHNEDTRTNSPHEGHIVHKAEVHYKRVSFQESFFDEKEQAYVDDLEAAPVKSISPKIVQKREHHHSSSKNSDGCVSDKAMQKKHASKRDPNKSHVKKKILDVQPWETDV